MRNLENKKKYLAIWLLICLAVVLIGTAIPVREARSLGLSGANQANLKSATEELTEGHELIFQVDMPSETASQIGFFFTINKHQFTEGELSICAYDGEEQIGKTVAPLADMEADQFLFVKFSRCPKTLTVRISSDAPEAGPSVWLNEVTVNPGTAQMDGESIEKSLVYNLTYTVMVHRFQKPMLIGLILLLGGIGVYGAGGFVRPVKKEKMKLPKKKGNRVRQMYRAGSGTDLLLSL